MKMEEASGSGGDPSINVDQKYHLYIQISKLATGNDIKIDNQSYVKISLSFERTYECL